MEVRRANQKSWEEFGTEINQLPRNSRQFSSKTTILERKK